MFLFIRLSDLVISAVMQQRKCRKRCAKKLSVGRFAGRPDMCLPIEQMPDRCAG
jgi:hypothetical protein